MREYSIKKGHKADLNELLKKYFNVEGNLSEGFEFEEEGIGKIFIKKEKNEILIDIKPPEKIEPNPEILKKWNSFLFEATGRSAKERKKLLEKEVEKI
ncbi:MAG: DUF5611 family protein [Thermoplasmatales archaeon]|nr:DUF5611 family protein [Thermoplasmatales archaeon]